MATVPEEYLCPISQEIMTEPVTDEFGHTYDKESLRKWLLTNIRSPITREQYTKTSANNLRVNVTLKAIIESYIKSSEQHDIQTIINKFDNYYDGNIKTSLTELEKHFNSLNNIKYTHYIANHIANVLKHLFLYVELEEQYITYEIKCVDKVLTNVQQRKQNILLSFLKSTYTKYKLTNEQMIDIVMSLLLFEYKLFDWNKNIEQRYDLNTLGLMSIAKQSFYDTVDKSKIKSPMVMIKFNALYNSITNIDLKDKNYKYCYGSIWRSPSTSQWIKKKLIDSSKQIMEEILKKLETTSNNNHLYHEKQRAHVDDEPQFKSIKAQTFQVQKLLSNGVKSDFFLKFVHENRYKFKYIIDDEHHSIEDWIMYKGITIDVDSFSQLERYLVELISK